MKIANDEASRAWHANLINTLDTMPVKDRAIIQEAAACAGVALQRHPDPFVGALGHVKQRCLVRALGGTLVLPELPSRESWSAMLERYAPGCGSPTYVAGTNGGEMPCGGWLNQLDGSRTQEFCPHCAEQLKPQSP